MSGYVGTADAILKYFSGDAEWCRLSDQFHVLERDPSKEREPKDEARAELAKREAFLLDNVYQAIVRQELLVLLMDGGRTFQLPGLYAYDSHAMANALRSGWASKLRLTGPDTAWQAARLVFPEENWRHWRGSQSAPSSEADSVSAKEVSKTPAVTPKERLNNSIANVRRDRVRLLKADFHAMCRYLGFRPNEFEKLWNEVVPEDWRKAGGGAPAEGAIVKDWRLYL